ncbi:MAG: HAD family hydrolase [Syntrophobacteraceae bacterium]
MNIDCFVFDFDGTLAELRLDFAAMKQQLNILGGRYLACVPPEPFLPALEWVSYLEGEIGKRGADSAGFRSEALALICGMEMEAAKSGALFPFTRPLLRMLRAKGVKTAIITRNSEAAVRVVFPDLSEFCPAFLARDHVRSPKPDPAHAMSALAYVRAEPRKAIMIGDHPLDIQTGKAAGMWTGGVCTGSATRSDLLAAGADWVSDDCRMLIEELIGESKNR